jgi:hypothetical protein
MFTGTMLPLYMIARELVGAQYISDTCLQRSAAVEADGGGYALGRRILASSRPPHSFKDLRGVMEVMLLLLLLLLLLLDPLPRSATRTASRNKVLFRQSTLVLDVNAQHNHTLNGCKTKNIDQMVDPRRAPA